MTRVIILKQIFKKYFFILFSSFVLAIFINSILYIFLPKTPTEHIGYNVNSKIYNIKISKVFCNNDKKNNKNINENILNFEELENLSLKAIYLENENEGFIIISDNNKEIFLQLNEKYKGYTLKKIGKNYAILQKDREYILYLEDKFEKEIFSQKISGKDQIEEYIKLKKSEIKKLKEKFDLLLEDIGIQKVEYDGKVAYKISYLKKYSPIRKFGLNIGDIIYMINGQSLDNISFLNDLLTDKDIETMQINLVRNGEKREIYYEIE